MSFDDDAHEYELWEAATSDVRKLGDKSSPKSSKKPRNPFENEINFAETADNFAQMQEKPLTSGPIGAQAQRNDPLTITSNQASLLAGHARGIDEKIRKKLAAGQISFTSRLDLHGYFEGDAWLATMDFLHLAVESGHRCVLIIHGKGKGYGLEGDMGIIKAQMAGWLAYHPKVLAFHTAIPKDGGAGAVYVYLKRDRLA